MAKYLDIELQTKTLKEMIKEIHEQKSISCELEPAAFDQESYELYRKYQIQIHLDPPQKLSVTSYKHFLIDAPFSQCMHLKYYLNTPTKKLVGVSVLDIVEDIVSSVYFYYDPDYKQLSLGTYSALYEITQLVQPDGAYYLGFYIPDCPKMKYKVSNKARKHERVVASSNRTFRDNTKGRRW